MDLELQVADVPIDEPEFTASVIRDGMCYTGTVKANKIVIPLNRYSVPIPGTSDEERFGLFGNIIVEVGYHVRKIRKEVFIRSSVRDVQLAYYDYNNLPQRTIVKVEESFIPDLETALKRGYEELTSSVVQLQSPVFMHLRIGSLFLGVVPAVKEVTEKYLRI